MNEQPMTSVRGKRMREYLPGFYSTSRVMSSILDAQGAELDKLRQALSETLDQFYVGTATWGLDIWERELGVPTNSAKPIEQRRSVVISKIRGIGSVTTNLIKSVTEAYDGGTVLVNVQPATYSFSIKFIDTRGIPPNLNDLQATIGEIKPAHLKVEYEFAYLLWDELDATNLSWDEFDAISMTWDEFETWKP